METTKTDLDLSQVWDALITAGAEVYEWCECGVATGAQVIRLGESHVITLDDADGYSLVPADDVEDAELISTEDYDEDAAVLAASDVTGFFGVVGVPGSQYHTFEWFEDEAEARAWAGRTHDEIRADNPIIGTLECDVLTAGEAFGVFHLDGSRVYFHPKACVPGFEPKSGEPGDD